MVATAGFRSRLFQQDSPGKLLVRKHKSHSNGRNVLLDNLMHRAAQTLWPARTANKMGKSTRPGKSPHPLQSQSRESVPTLDTLQSDSDLSLGQISDPSRSTPASTKRVLPEWLVDTMSAMPPQDPLRKLSNSRSLSINQTDSIPAEATLLNGPTYSEGSFSVFLDEFSPSPPSLDFKSNPLSTSVELHHPIPIKRVVTPYIFDELPTYQHESMVTDLDDRIMHDQEANADDYETKPEFPHELIMCHGSDLGDLSTLGDLTAAYGIGADSNIYQVTGSSGSAQHTRHLPYPPDDISVPMWRQHAQPTTPSPKHPAGFQPLKLGQAYERPPQRHLGLNNWDPVSEVLSREHRSFISPLLGMTALNHDLETNKVQLLSPVTPPSGSGTKHLADHLSTWGVPFSSIKSSVLSSGHLPPSRHVITDAFNRKLMRHASTNYSPLPALNFVDALLRRHRDNKYVPRGHGRFYPQLHKPESADGSPREGGVVSAPANQTSELDNLVVSSGGRSTDARLADSYARGAFTPNQSHRDAASESEPRVMFGGCETPNAIQYHEGVPLDKLLTPEANRGSPPSLPNIAQPVLHMSRRQHGNSLQDNSTPVRGATESWLSRNDNSSNHVSLGNVALRSDVNNTARCLRTPPSKLLPADNRDVSLSIRNAASYPRTPPSGLSGQVDRNSGAIECPTLEQSTCIHTGGGTHARIAADRSIVDAPGSTIREECARPEEISPPDMPGERDEMMPEDLPFSEMMEEDWVTPYENGVATYGADARTPHSHNEAGGGSSVASSMLAENDDVLEWSGNEGSSREDSHDSIESWSNTDVLSFLKGQL